jgi:hypothetical protein
MEIMPPPKYVVFDLDETLGYFTELSIIWGCLQSIYNVKGQQAFNELCNVFEKDYFRPGIFHVMGLLHRLGPKVKVVLYTNNTGQLSWLKMIIRYIENRSGVHHLFSKIVPGYKPNMTGACARTSFEKTYLEILRCAAIPPQSKVLFLDDQWHPKMNYSKVTYIRVKPFFNPLTPETIIRRLQHSYFSFLDFSTHTYLYNCIQHYQKQASFIYHWRRISHVTIDNTEILNAVRRFVETHPKTIKRKKKRSQNKTRKQHS